jgi:hypothetical protein
LPPYPVVYAGLHYNGGFYSRMITNRTLIQWMRLKVPSRVLIRQILLLLPLDEKALTYSPVIT